MEMKMENSLVELVSGVEAYWTDAQDRDLAGLGIYPVLCSVRDHYCSWILTLASWIRLSICSGTYIMYIHIVLSGHRRVL
jgi:hypothetical protein